MKFCPICDARYDEEIIKFCTRDGAPLLEEGQPSFTALPSENIEPSPDDDLGEDTIITRKPMEAGGDEPAPREPAERIVIPTSQAAEQQVRQRAATAYYPPP